MTSASPTRKSWLPDWKNLIVFFGSWLLFFLATWFWTYSTHESLGDPPTYQNVDGVFYDNMGFHVSRGEGFTVDPHSEPWRSEYQSVNQAAGQDRYGWVMLLQGAGPTTMRSPGYPAALGALYWLFGWSWWAARVFGLLAVSGGLALWIAWAGNRWGLWTAAVATATLAIDYSVMQAASMIASEALAIPVIAIAILLWVRAVESPSMQRWILAGLAFAALALVRGNWNLALVILVFGSLLLVMGRVRQWIQPISWRHVVVFVATWMIVSSPWRIRNCVLTGHFQPFGTAGANGLSAAYCDESLADGGNFQEEPYRENQIEVRSKLDLSKISLAEREYLTGRESTLKAIQWTRENLHHVPKLMGLRLLSHWGLLNESVPLPFQIANILLIGAALVGLTLIPGRVRTALIVILLVDAAVVMLTWENGGRYGIPLRPLLHLLTAVTITTVMRFWWQTARRVWARIGPRQEIAPS